MVGDSETFNSRIEEAQDTVPNIPNRLGESYEKCRNEVDDWLNMLNARAAEFIEIVRNPMDKAERAYFDVLTKQFEANYVGVAHQLDQLKNHSENNTEISVREIEEFTKKQLLLILTLAEVKTILGAAEAYDKLATYNWHAGIAWAVIFATAFGISTYLLCTLFWNFETDSLSDLNFGNNAIGAILQRVVFLKTIYQHRLAALKHYGDFATTIPDEEATIKAQLRLELGKMIFSDPTTGLIKNSEADVNINPLVTTLGNLRS